MENSRKAIAEQNFASFAKEFTARYAEGEKARKKTDN
jgi:queuine/archaeosine tRNA-ribosyltransferase